MVDVTSGRAYYRKGPNPLKAALSSYVKTEFGEKEAEWFSSESEQRASARATSGDALYSKLVRGKYLKNRIVGTTRI